jgi:hypothetical protein
MTHLSREERAKTKRQDAFLAAKSSYVHRLKEPDKHKDVTEEFAKIVENGYVPLFVTDNIVDAKDAEYRCVVFIKPGEKKVLFANAGTRIGKFGKKAAFADLYDDALLAIDSIPKKFPSAQAINQHVLDLLQHYPEGDVDGDGKVGNTDISDWQFEYVGHSLGAAMARLQSLDMHMKIKDIGKKQNISVKLFDSPAYSQLLNTIVDEHNTQNARNYRLDDLLAQEDIEIYQARSNLVNAIGEDSMLHPKLNQKVYEVFNLDEKTSFFEKLMHSRIGRVCWGSIKNTCVKLSKKKFPHASLLLSVGVGVAVGAAVGGALSGPFGPAGAVIGAFVGKMSEELIKEIIKSIKASTKLQAIKNKLLHLPQTISDITSHSLSKFAGVGINDERTSCLEIVPFDIKGVNPILASSRSLRMIRSDDGLYNQLLELSKSGRAGVKRFYETSIEQEMRKNTLCKYFIKNADGELIGCSRKMLLIALKNLRSLEKQEEIVTKISVQEAQIPEGKIRPEQKASLIDKVSQSSESETVKTPEIVARKTPEQQEDRVIFERVANGISLHRSLIEENSDKIQESYHAVRNDVEKIAKPIMEEPRVLAEMEEYNGIQVQTLDPAKIKIDGLRDGADFIISRNFGENISIIAEYKVKDGKAICSDLILPSIQDMNLELVDKKKGINVLEEHASKNPNLSQQKLLEDYLNKHPNVKGLEIRLVGKEKEITLCSAGEFLKAKPKIIEKPKKSWSENISMSSSIAIKGI